MRRIKHILTMAVIVFICFIFCMPLILPFNKVVVEESYLQFCSYLDLNLIYLAKEHKIPFWAFHFGGGYPFIKHPDNIVLSPLFYIMILPFGSGNGLKLFLLFSYAVGAVGFYLFVNRALKFNLFASAATTMFFIFNSFIPFQINTGNVKDQGWLYLPLITYTLFLSKENRRSIFYCACLITLIFLNGLSLYMAPMILFLFIFVLLDAVSRKEDRIISQKTLFFSLFLILILTFFLGAIKSFPLLELLESNARAINQYKRAAIHAMTFKKMILAFFSRGPYAVGNESVMGPNGLGMGSVMYFGGIPLMLFILSCMLCFKKVWRYLLVAVIFISISMTENSPIDLFYILWHLPLFNSIHEAARYFSFPVIFMISVAAGFFFSSKLFMSLNKYLKLIVCLLTFVGAAEMFVANTKYYKFAGSYQEPIPRIRAEEEFFSVRQRFESVKDLPFYESDKRWGKRYREELPPGLQYYLLRQNIGLINWYANIELENEAITPRYEVLSQYGGYWRDFRKDLSEKNGILKNERYRGESFFRDHKENRVKGVQWYTNRIVVDVEQDCPDRLIINQNYDREWRTDTGRICNADRLLGVILDDPVKGKIVLSYHPLSFYRGAVASVACLVLCILIFFVKPGRRGKIS